MKCFFLTRDEDAIFKRSSVTLMERDLHLQGKQRCKTYLCYLQRWKKTFIFEKVWKMCEFLHHVMVAFIFLKYNFEKWKHFLKTQTKLTKLDNSFFFAWKHSTWMNILLQRRRAENYWQEFTRQGQSSPKTQCIDANFIMFCPQLETFPK